jgi:serine protease Do
VVIRDESGFTTAISTVAEAMMPTVVHIDITGTVVQQAPAFPFGNDPFFREFFGPQQRQQRVPIRALGSGVIISADGYIITNNHVVANAEEITVELYDGTTQKATLVGTDPNTDLAVVKISPTSNMRYATLGDSDAVKVGEWVVAIGSPRGLDWTVTAGIVSAKNRSEIGALGPAGYEDFIQTDASINPGNSGGPLINLRGEVIGINSLIVSASMGSEGLGFASPSDLAKDISRSLIEHGKVVRGYLGVNIQDITPEIARGLKLEKDTRGVIVTDIVPGSPAEKAGLKQGDVILKYDGKRVESVAKLRSMAAATAPGQLVKITVSREGRELDLSLTAGELARTQGERRPAENDLLGASVETVTPQIATQLGLRRASGVIVTEVVPGSAAESAGLQKGDIIYRVNNSKVDSAEEFDRRISEAKKQGSVMLLLREVRSGNTRYITVPLK